MSGGSAGTIGGLIGLNQWYGQVGTVTNSFYNTQTTGQAQGVGDTADAAGMVVGLTTAQMMDPASFASWSIDSVGGQDAVWRIYAGLTAPLLKSFLTTAYVTTDASSTRAVYNGLNQTGAITGTVTLADGSAADAGLVHGTATSTCSGGDASCINAGSYSLAVSGGLYSGQQGYDLIYVAPVGNTATLTITPVSGSVSGSGFVHGEGVTNLSGTALWTATTGGNAGSYAITAQQAAGNTSAYTISPAALTLTYTATPVSILFGQSLPALDGTIGVAGLLNGDTQQTTLSGGAKWTSSATGGSATGSYGITGSGLQASANYTLIPVQAVGNATALTITPSGQNLAPFLPGVQATVGNAHQAAPNPASTGGTACGAEAFSASYRAAGQVSPCTAG